MASSSVFSSSSSSWWEYLCALSFRCWFDVLVLFWLLFDLWLPKWLLLEVGRCWGILFKDKSFSSMPGFPPPRRPSLEYLLPLFPSLYCTLALLLTLRLGSTAAPAELLFLLSDLWSLFHWLSSLSLRYLSCCFLTADSTPALTIIILIMLYFDFQISF